MKNNALLRALFRILIAAALVCSSLSAQVIGSAMAAVTMTEMADEMPCCADERPVFPDCQKACPFMTVCVTKCFPGTLTVLEPTFGVLRASAEPGADAHGSSLSLEPPARPPRT